MTYINNTNIQFSDSPSIDAFGRARTSTAFNQFNSKQVNDNLDIVWDTETGGTSGNIVYNKDNAESVLSVAVSGDYVIRQTNSRFNYQPGKSETIFETGIIGEPDGNGDINSIIGYFNSSEVAPYSTDYDGLYFENDGTNINVVIAHKGSITKYPKSSWNVDKFDGSGNELNPSNINIDFNKCQIFTIDFEWLGVGRVRFGFVIDGKIYYCHYVNNANNVESVYMQSPNHSVRYEIRSTGGSGSLTQICSSVQSESGTQTIGLSKTFNTGVTEAQAYDINGLDTYPLISIRLNENYINTIIEISKINIISTSKSDYRWELILNPTISVGGDSFTYSYLSNSSVDIGVGGRTTNPYEVTASGGIKIDSGYISDVEKTTSPSPDILFNLGKSINGTYDILVLCVSQVGSTFNDDIYASITWKELL